MSLTEKDCLKSLDIRIIILSRSRSSTISTHEIFPDWVEILVPDNEVEEYKKVVKNPILSIPSSIHGLGRVRNWVLDNFKEETIIMIDDDISGVRCNTKDVARVINDKEEILQILINTAVMAKDAGCHCFWYAQRDVRFFNGTEPFSLCTWVGCVIGVIGRKYRFRDDKFKVDIDFCMQNILVDRIIWVDSRYYWYQKRDSNTGGNSLYRTQEEFEKSTNSLIEKWGRFLKVSKKYTNQISIRMNVKRRQKIDYE